MSVKIMSWVWDNGPDDKTDLLVLLALADFCDDEGICYPSIRRIAEKSRLTERGVQKVIRRLESGGFLKIKTGNGRHGTNTYALSKRANSVRGNEAGNPEHGAPEHGSGGEHGCKKPRTRVQETPNGRSPEPSRTVREPSVSEILGEVASPDVVADFIEHRRQMKKPLTQVAAKRMAKRLAECGSADAALSLSIENGWQGVFPEKVRETRKPQSGGSVPFYERILKTG